MVHSDAIWNGVLKVGTAEKKSKAKTQNAAFWRYLKRCFGSWNCWENVESKESKGCILTLFVIEVGTAEKKSKAKTQNVAFWGYLKRCFESLNCWERKQARTPNVHSDASWNDVYRSLKCRENVDTKGKMVHSGSIWNDALKVGTTEKIWKKGS